MAQSRESLISSMMAVSGAKGIIDAINKLEQTFKKISSYIFADN